MNINKELERSTVQVEEKQEYTAGKEKLILFVYTFLPKCAR